MVTVVDAANFREELQKAEPLQHRGESLGEDDHRTVNDLLVDQVEFADVIVLNKIDLVDDAGLQEVEGTIRALNPGAHVIRAEHSRIPLDQVLNTERFDYDEAATSAGWIRELNNTHTPETEEYGFTSFVFRTHKPFDAERLWIFLNMPDGLKGVIRSKGFFWVAADHRVAYEWAHAGGQRTVRPAAMWWAAVPRDRWEFPPGERPDERPSWDARYGDRCQEIVFIGRDMDEQELRACLAECLLSDELLQLDSAQWARLPNPFPPLA